MTSPNARFNPAMRGTATADQLQTAAAALASDAQIAALNEQEAARHMLLNDFVQARDANRSAASRGLPVDVARRVVDFCDRCTTITSSARALVAAVPLPLMSSEVTGYIKQRVYNQALIDNALAAQTAIVAKAMQGADQEAAAILDMAWLAAVPNAPDRALSGTVDDAVADIRTALASGVKAENILAGTIASGDDVMAYALLGEPGRRLLTAMGVNRVALCRTWAQGKLAAVKPDDNGVFPLGQSFPGASFLYLQSTDQALAKLPSLANAYYDAMLARTKQLLANSVVMANMR